jgi:fengycin family lipopeptide synthetase D
VGEKRFHSFFQETRQRILDAFAHAGYPYEELVEQVTLARDMSRNPLFDVMFDWQGFDFPAVEAPGLKMTPFPHRGKIAKYDLTLQAFLSGETLTCIFAYCSELFKPETLARWVDYFRETVAAVLEDLHREIATVELISKEEKTRILESCNGIRLDFPQAKPLHRLFAEQASRTPHRVAAAEAEAILSYGQLHRETRQAARLLKERGVKPGTVVGIGVERSLEMLIGIFAILEAGAAYLPLPPSLPLGRSKWVIKESALGFLLTSAPVIPGAAPGRDGRDLEIIVLEERHGRDSTGEQRESEAAGSGHELAYVIYTSGSTGTPKGVMVEHGSVVNRLNWMQWAYPLGAADTVIQKTPITFDVSVWELFWWFLGGASLFLLEAGAEANPDALIRAIAKNPNTTMHFVPSMLNVFLEYIEGNSASHRLAGLKQLFSSGEALSPGLAEKFNRLPGVERGVRLVNLYGPTEATVDVSYFNVPGERELALIPIGKPIANIALLIVDGHLNLQPVGIAGELLIAGVGVARGYMNNPELTVERFCRLRQKTYRTGDLARRLPDGNIEFLGRMDRQVKIRGIRIEPAEIEKGLLSHDNISAAVVLEKHDNNDSELCAYIVTRGEAEVPGLKAYLAEFLPEAMIPAVFVRIRQIPLKPNGKLDREALERGGARLPSGVAYTAPENPIERTVALLWSEVLKIQEIGVEEIFFNIGGNSLKLIRLFGRLKEVYPEAVEIQDLFDYPTIRRLARRIAAKIAPTPLSPREQRRKVEF